MWLNRTSAPAATAVSLAEAKAHLRVLHDEDDDYITALIAQATEHLEGRNGIVGRAMVTQSWEYRIDAFPSCNRIELPMPPLQTVASIKYIDSDGVEQTLATSVYAVDTGTLVGQVRLKYGQSWPATRAEEFAVRITFTAGYGAASAVPAPLKAAMKLLIGHWYVNRDMGMDLPQGAPFAIEALITPYRLGMV
jgi:uncharacterized phiE125 gp8 family phage protein